MTRTTTKMKRIIEILVAAALLLCTSSCSDTLDNTFHDYFVCIRPEDGSRTTRISATANMTITYYVYLVAPIFDEDVVVDYEIVAGDGLADGVDYQVLNTGSTISFLPGIDKQPIRVKYISHAIDPDKDNTLTIRLKSVNRKDLHIGYPGPAANYSTHVITKY